jgi:hypothetical protein
VIKTDNKVVILVRDLPEIKKMHKKEIVLKVNRKYYFCHVIKYAGKYVIYIPSSENREELLKKEEIEFEIITHQ